MAKRSREITLQNSRKYRTFNLILGKKWRATCRKAIQNLWECAADDQATETSVGEESSKACRLDSDDERSDESFESHTAEIPVLNASLTSIGESSVNQKELSSRKRYRE